MAKLVCKDYGFECDYTTEGDEASVVTAFRDHMEDEHGIEYSPEAVLMFVMRKQQ